MYFIQPLLVDSFPDIDSLPKLSTVYPFPNRFNKNIDSGPPKSLLNLQKHLSSPIDPETEAHTVREFIYSFDTTFSTATMDTLLNRMKIAVMYPDKTIEHFFYHQSTRDELGIPYYALEHKPGVWVDPFHKQHEIELLFNAIENEREFIEFIRYIIKYDVFPSYEFCIKIRKRFTKFKTIPSWVKPVIFVYLTHG